MLDPELKLYKYIIKAQTLEPTDQDYEEIETAAGKFFVASNAPFENGKPRMLFLSAWMAHEGRNLNGDAFVSEELRQRVKEGLFTPPYAGMIDEDHDFVARGYWYKTSYAFDETAQKWGVLATGAVWAWRYPELAEFVQQQMQSQGFAYVSMSAIAEVTEVTTHYAGFEGKVTSILHNPVFFTSAILTVPPGDPDAKVVSVATENKDVAAEARADGDSIDNKEIIMTEQEIKDQEALKTTNAQLQQEVADLKVKLTEAEVNFTAVSAIKSTVEQELETVRADLKVFKDKEAAEAEKNKAAADQKKFESRLAEVPDVVRDNLNKHPNKELVLARWKEATEPDWDVIKQGFALAYTAAPSYLDRSRNEGKLPVGSEEQTENQLKSYLKD